MSGSCRVTPAITVTDTTVITAAELNQLAKPSVQIEPQSVGKAELIKSDLLDVIGGGASNYNYLDNGNFAENRWSRGSTPVSCPAGARTYRADQWWCQPSGAAVTYERAESGPDAVSLHSAKLSGATGVTTVDFGQDIPRRLATALARPLLLSFWLRNDTGGTLTPTARLDTPTTADNFSAVTNQLSVAATVSTANGQWGFYQIPLDASLVSALAMGGRFVLRIPSGALDSVSKSVKLARLKLEVTAETAATPFVPEREPDEPSPASAAPTNLLRNGQFDRFLQPGVSVTCSADIDTANAEAWFVHPNGGAATSSRSALTPTNNLTAFSLRVTGASGVNAVAVGQNLTPATAQKLRRNVTFTIWVRYHDGSSSATVTPTINLATPAATGDFAGATVQLTTDLAPCPHDTWTQLTYTFDGSLITNLANGLRLYLEWPSGSLDASAKYVDFGQAQLQEGVDTPVLHPYLEAAEPAIIGQASGLVLDTASGTTFTVAADELTLRNAEGRPMVVHALSCTVNIATVGVNGLETAGLQDIWFYIFVISNGASHAGLMSASATAPVVPAGYTYKALVGAIYASSTSVLGFHQVGRRVWITPQTVAFTHNTSRASINLVSQVPPNARTVFGLFGVTTNTALSVWLTSDNNSFLRGHHICNQALAGVTVNGFYAVTAFELPLVTPQTIWHIVNSTSPTHRLDVLGFTL